MNQVLRLSDIEVESAAAAEAEDAKQRLKRIGWGQERFAAWLGLATSTLRKWKIIGVPAYALRLIEFLETYHVPPAWNPAGTKPRPTPEDAKRAMSLAILAVTKTAENNGWTRQQIAGALREIADDVDGRSPPPRGE